MDEQKTYQSAKMKIQRLKDSEILNEMKVLNIFIGDLKTIRFNVSENEYNEAYTMYKLNDRP